MKKTQQNLLWLAFIVLFAQGCATLMHGSTQQITVNSSPPGATVLVNGFMRFTTPTVLELTRKESHRLDISLEGYHPEVVEVRSVPSTMVAGNIIAGGLVGLLVDHSTGAASRLVPEVVQVSLRPILPEPQKVPAAADQKEGETTTKSQD